MKIKIVADSGCDLNDEIKEKTNIKIVPLTIQLDEKIYKDNEKLDINKFIQDMKKSQSSPRTASPSPLDFIEQFKGDESVFVVTLSSALSSTYNNALMAKEMYKEKFENKFIHVFDSLSASVGETLVSLKIFELAKENYENAEIVKKVSEYIKEMKTFFILESLDNLMKAGRLSKVKGKIASMLSIKPIMGSSDEGTIKLVEKVRGSKRAFKRLVQIIGEQGEKLEDKILGIAHCNCLEKAEKIKKEVLKRYNFKDIVIVDMAGISTAYAEEGGIVIAF
ncbi:DegV family protein [Thermohalobacter berrensis]|uniref:Fatty acid-binding protein DegV n=1 Tax=Thermohalobacter berrensis TaxID=99594 RepID=A0A419SZD6_9FIRM|nr:DegV family protein [Thermohalobacter berrensis]RKD30630.1 fatty acid-binding protein DegV [Thermohalobacter berrensis]